MKNVQKLFTPEQNIGAVLGENYLDRFIHAKNNHPQNLFGMDWGNVKQGACPICGNKLYEMRKQPRLYCRSKKHRKPFSILKEKVLALK